MPAGLPFCSLMAMSLTSAKPVTPDRSTVTPPDTMLPAPFCTPSVKVSAVLAPAPSVTFHPVALRVKVRRRVEAEPSAP